MKSSINRSLLFLAMIVLAAATASAQNAPPLGDDDPKLPRAAARRNLLRQLGLSRVQVRQVSQLNVGRRPLMQSAQQRFREANRLLDEAIYADKLDEAKVQEKIKEVQQAQAELIRARSMSELALRKILTPEQLTRFRQMRQR